MKEPVLLAYNLSKERAEQIAPLAEQHHIRLRPVSPAEYCRTLNELCPQVRPMIL